MKKIIWICIVLCGCSTPYITTVWKNQHAFPGKYNKIMIVVILSNEDTVIRARIENYFKESLEELGYQTVSSYAEFGAIAFSNLGQGDSYLKLCNKGIDAVMTIAMVEKKNDAVPEPLAAFLSPATYYYDRLWDYKKLQLPTTKENTKYTWEGILFDLSTLQPHYIMQTKPFNGTVEEALGREFWKGMIRRLQKERFLKKHALVPPGPKAF